MGTKSKKKAKTRLDAYYRMAKEQGFRSRAAYKLIQLNKKYDFLARSKVVVDLCAAPGGWCQVAAQHMPVGSKIVGVDLVPIAPIRGVKTFVGDITDDKTRKTIKTWLKKEPVDCVIHDGAPNVGGVWAKDLFAQNALVLCAAKMACDLLKPGGWFVTKVFRSPDYQKLLWVMKQLFEKVEATKPLASRMESAEIFVTCAGYKAPKNLDARLFQTQHVFADVGEEKVMTPSGLLVMPRTNVPQGYDEFATILSRTATLSQYLDCEDPKEFLKKYHEIRFESEEERALHRSRWSKPELVILCQDLQQVSDGDKRRLLRWREQLQRERATRRLNETPIVAPDAAAKPKKVSVAADGDAAEGSSDDDDDYSDVSSDGGAVLDEDAAVGGDLDAMTKQLLEIRRAREKDKKRKQKKMVDRKLKKVRGLINYDPTESAHSPTEMTEGANKRLKDDEVDDSTDEGSDDEMEGNEGDWSIADLGTIPEKQVAKLFDKNFEEDDNNGLNVPLNAITDVLINPDDEMEVGSQDEFDVHDKLLEEGGDDGELDVDFHGNYMPNAKTADRVTFFDTPGVNDSDDEDAAAVPAGKHKPLTAEEKKQKRLDKNAEKLDEVGKQSKWQRRHLNVEQVLRETFPKASAAGKAGKRRGRNEEDLVEMGDGAAGSITKGPSSRALTREMLQKGRLHDESDDTDNEDDDDISSLEAAMAESDDERGGSDDGAKLVAGRGKQRGKMQVLVPDIGKLTAMEQVKAQRKQLKKDNKKNKSAAKKNKKDDTAFEEIPLAMTDPDVRARTLALATKMLDKRSRKEILDGSINRFMHNDDEDMPDWFIKDEQRNNKIYMPVTAAEIDAQRRRFQEMNLRPGKKVMEAMGRKRRKAQRMLRGLLDKGKTDPSVRNKVQGLSVRKLMRSKAVKGPGIQKKKEPLDNKRRGEKRREKQAAKRAGKGKR